MEMEREGERGRQLGNKATHKVYICVCTQYGSDHLPMDHLVGLMSTAMIRDAPAALAPIMTARPTHPHPNTATLDPSYTAMHELGLLQ